MWAASKGFCNDLLSVYACICVGSGGWASGPWGMLKGYSWELETVPFIIYSTDKLSYIGWWTQIYRNMNWMLNVHSLVLISEWRGKQHYESNKLLDMQLNASLVTWIINSLIGDHSTVCEAAKQSWLVMSDIILGSTKSCLLSWSQSTPQSSDPAHSPATCRTFKMTLPLRSISEEDRRLRGC